MRTRLIIPVIGCACFLVLQAHAVSIGFNDALGYVAPGTSSSDAANANYVNGLVARADGVDPSPYDVPGNIYNLIQTLGGGLPLADPNNDKTGGVGGDNSVDATGYFWLIVKYDGAGGEAYVWDVNGLGVVTVPGRDPADNTNNKFLLFNSGGQLTPQAAVPDYGSTLVLSGLAFGALASLRRRLS